MHTPKISWQCNEELSVCSDSGSLALNFTFILQSFQIPPYAVAYLCKQLKKIQEKADKCRRDVETAKDKYEATLNDLNAYNAKYMEDMTEVSGDIGVTGVKVKWLWDDLFKVLQHLVWSSVLSVH